MSVELSCVYAAEQLRDEVFVRGRSSPYHGSLEIHGYCDVFVGSLARLERVIDCVRSHV